MRCWRLGKRAATTVVRFRPLKALLLSVHCSNVLFLQTLDLSQVFLGVEPQQFLYRLHSMVCYYGQHYQAFVHMPSGSWFMFDDANIAEIGDWSSVITKCGAGRVQASILFFERPDRS